MAWKRGVAAAVIVTAGIAVPNHFVAAQRTSIASGAWSSIATWAGGIVPQAGDTVTIASGDSVYLDQSTAPLSAVSVFGWLSLGTDTIFYNASPNDTVIQISGTLDAGSGWFAFAAPISPRPVIHVAASGRFRMSSPIPFPTPGIFDSLVTPLIACDDSSTFEYYSQNLDLMDVSFLANNLIGHSYANLVLNGMDASFRSNPVRIRGTLTIDSGASIIAAARLPGVKGYDTQTIRISGDVVNQNGGESGSPGAGLRGCGMQSSGSDEWLFDRFLGGSAKDTCHWSGPSQLGSVVVGNNTVLSVRYSSDRSCDSLDILTQLTEENPPCGGHLIGKVYSEFPRTLDASNPVDSFYGLGLTIRSGTVPYLGRTRVVRVSGYAPPGVRPDARTARRYYIITSGASPQEGLPNEMTFRLHCDELNGTNPTHLHFWRSRDEGQTWAFSGITAFDPAHIAYVWDTTVLGLADDSGSFCWMLSEGYTDQPTPIDLVRFSATRAENSVELNWETAQEVNVAGFELDRGQPGASTAIASFLSDRDLASQSKYGATYSFLDTATGLMRYDLYEVSNDGIRTWLGNRWVSDAGALPDDVPEVEIRDGVLSMKGSVNGQSTGRVTIVDAIGRQILFIELNSHLQIPLRLLQGIYFVRLEMGDKIEVRKYVQF